MRDYIKIVTILAVPLVILLVYAIIPYRIHAGSFTLEKIDLGNAIGLDPRSIFPDDSVMLAKTDSTASLEKENKVDTVSKRILIFGDSMVEGLTPRLADYCAQNGHTLYSVCWYGSSTVGWAGRIDSLRSYVAWASPDYIMVSLGGNELEARDTQRRRECIMQIMEVIGNRPCVWIATPSWVEKPTITEIQKDIVGKNRYYDTTKLTLQRGPDHMHPTFSAFAIWMDSVAVWLGSPQTAHPIKMQFPAKGIKRNWKSIIIGVDGVRRGVHAPAKNNTAVKPAEADAISKDTPETTEISSAQETAPATPVVQESPAAPTE
jgi:hypothetical protein